MSQPKKAPPPGWPRVSCSMYYDDPARAIDWLCEAFGFELRLKVEGDGGSIVHSELTYGEGMLMVGDATRSNANDGSELKLTSPRAVGGRNTQNIMIYVDDVDGHCKHAREHGAVVTSEPATHDYGDDYWADRSYGCVDLEGHRWWFCERIKTGANKGGVVKHETPKA